MKRVPLARGRLLSLLVSAAHGLHDTGARLLQPGRVGQRGSRASRLEPSRGGAIGRGRRLPTRASAPCRPPHGHRREPAPAAAKRFADSSAARAGALPDAHRAPGHGAGEGTRRYPSVTKLGLLSVLLWLPCAACSATPGPLPAGPPPEYEQPRSYQPQSGDIDTLGEAAAPSGGSSPSLLPGSTPPMMGMPPAGQAAAPPAAGGSESTAPLPPAPPGQPVPSVAPAGSSEAALPPAPATAPVPSASPSP